MKPPKKDLSDLFDRYYEVSYRHFDSRTPEQIRRNGFRTSGIPEIDKSIMTYEVRSELTINAMFELWRTGVTIRILKFDDSAEIYEIIQRHIVLTADAIKGQINGPNHELLTDMVDLDRFASVVYGKAKSIFTEQERNAVINNSFLGMQSINFFNILNKDYSEISEIRVDQNGKRVVKETSPKLKTAPVRERTDLSSVFVEQMERAGGLGGNHGKT